MCSTKIIQDLRRCFTEVVHWFIYKLIKENILTSTISSFTIKHVTLLWITPSLRFFSYTFFLILFFLILHIKRFTVIILANGFYLNLSHFRYFSFFSVILRFSFSPEIIHTCSSRISLKLDSFCLSDVLVKFGLNFIRRDCMNVQVV